MGLLEKVCISLNNSKLRTIMGKVKMVDVAWSRYRLCSASVPLAVLRTSRPKVCIRLGNSKLREIFAEVSLVAVAWRRHRGF